jgi:hypothetical protein
MERSPFLPLPEGMVIGQVEIAQAQLSQEADVWSGPARPVTRESPARRVKGGENTF